MPELGTSTPHKADTERWSGNPMDAQYSCSHGHTIRRPSCRLGGVISWREGLSERAAVEWMLFRLHANSPGNHLMRISPRMRMPPKIVRIDTRLLPAFDNRASPSEENETLRRPEFARPCSYWSHFNSGRSQAARKAALMTRLLRPSG